MGFRVTRAVATALWRAMLQNGNNRRWSGRGGTPIGFVTGIIILSRVRLPSRICRGVELDPLYVAVIARRFEAATGNQAILVETGETLEALAGHRTLEPALP
jgi:hypothetical protein